MHLTDISQEIYDICKRLNKASQEIFRLGREKSEFERDYRMSLSKELLRLRVEGMAATLIPDIARGNVSDALFKRDVSESTYQSAIQSMNVLKANLSALQSLLRNQQDV